MSTKVKSSGEIVLVRNLNAKGLSIRAIARETEFSRNTVKKILRRVEGYEKNEFDSSVFKGRNVKRSDIIHISEVDEEELHITKIGSEYPRMSKHGNRMYVHVYETKKLFKFLGEEWKGSFIIHHIDATR